MDKVRPTILTNRTAGINYNDFYNFKFSKIVYWWDVFATLDGNLHLKNKINDIIYDLLHNKAFFIINHGTDPIRQHHITEGHPVYYVIQRFLDAGVDKRRIIILSPLPDSLFYLVSNSPFYTTKFRVKKAEYEFCHFTYNSLFQRHKIAYADYQEKNDHYPIDKYFLCLSRRDSLNRRFINYLLHKNNLFEKGHISHQRVTENGILKSKSEHRRELEILSTRLDFDLESYKKYGYESLHFLDNRSIGCKGYASMCFDDYAIYSQKTCFELVTETDIDFTMFVTEKTLKPITFKKPFLVSGSAFTLKYLKKLGFLTFSDIFDESYDTEHIYYDRVHSIMRNIRNFSSLPLLECVDKVKRVQEICNYNYDHFFKSDWSFNIERKIQTYIDKFS